jgi:hypothetical protein
MVVVVVVAVAVAVAVAVTSLRQWWQHYRIRELCEILFRGQV